LSADVLTDLDSTDDVVLLAEQPEALRVALNKVHNDAITL